MNDSLVNLNTATAEELQTLPGIGPVLAKAIVDYRGENGLFEKVDELVNVPGMTKPKITAVVGLVEVEKSWQSEGSKATTSRNEASKSSPTTPTPPLEDEAFEDWLPSYTFITEVATKSFRVKQGVSSQYAQVGRLVDMWATLIEGFGEQPRAERMAYETDLAFEGRGARNVGDMEVRRLWATGWFPHHRRMMFYKRQQATVTVYFATQGKDLYISWRAFLQGLISWVRVVAVVFLVILFSAIASIEVEVGWRGTTETSFNWGTFGGGIVVVSLVVGVLSVIWGFVYREGDFLALYRSPLSEFQVDDILSLIYAVHGSILAAATKLGVDMAKLEKYEPFCAPKNRVRGRF